VLGDSKNLLAFIVHQESVSLITLEGNPKDWKPVEVRRKEVGEEEAEEKR
jgi:hypothetical protein